MQLQQKVNVIKFQYKLQSQLLKMQCQYEYEQQKERDKLKKKNKEISKIKQEQRMQIQSLLAEKAEFMRKIAQTQIQIQSLRSNNSRLSSKIKQLSRSQASINSSFSGQFLKSQNQKLQQQLKCSKKTILKYKYEADSQISSITCKLTQALKRQKLLKKQIEQILSANQGSRQAGLNKTSQLIQKNKIYEAQIQNNKEKNEQILRETKREYQRQINQLKIELAACKSNIPKQIYTKNAKRILQKSQIQNEQQRLTKQQTLITLAKLNKQIKWQKQQIDQLVQQNKALSTIARQKSAKIQQFQRIVLEIDSDLSQMRLKSNKVEQQNLRLLEQFQKIVFYSQKDIRTLLEQFKSKYEQKIKNKQSKLNQIEVQNAQIFQHHKERLSERQKLILQNQQHIQELQQKIKQLKKNHQQQKQQMISCQAILAQQIRQQQKIQKNKLKDKLQRILDADSNLQNYCKQIKQDLGQTTIMNANLLENQQYLRKQLQKYRQIIRKIQQELNQVLKRLSIADQKIFLLQTDNRQLNILVEHSTEKHEFLKAKLKQVKQEYQQQICQIKDEVSRVRQQNQLLKQLFQYQKNCKKSQSANICSKQSNQNSEIGLFNRFNQLKNTDTISQTKQKQLLMKKRQRLETDCAKTKKQPESNISRELQLYSFMQLSKRLFVSQSSQQIKSESGFIDQKRRQLARLYAQNKYLNDIQKEFAHQKNFVLQKQKIIHQITNQKNVIQQTLKNKIEQNQYIMQSLKNNKRQLQVQRLQNQRAINSYKQQTKTIKTLKSKIIQHQNRQKVNQKNIKDLEIQSQILKKIIQQSLESKRVDGFAKQKQFRSNNRRYHKPNSLLNYNNVNNQYQDLPICGHKIQKNSKNKYLSANKQHHVSKIEIPSKDNQLKAFSRNKQSSSSNSQIKKHIY